MAVSPMRVTMKALRAAAAVCRILVPEPDQEIAAETHAFPSEIEEQQVVGQHEGQHGADEEVHVGKEAAVAFVVLHEFGGIEMDEESRQR